MPDTTKRLTRRALLLGGTGASIAFGSVAVASRDMDDSLRTLGIPENAVSLPRNGRSVVIVGGGLSGLITGCELIDRGFDVTILEKNATLGGRLRSWIDRDFGLPSQRQGWEGHPIEHGTHIIFNFYRNFRDVLARRGLSVRDRPINYPMPAISFAYPDGTIDDRAPSKLPAPFHMFPLLHDLRYVPEEANRQLVRAKATALFGFNPNDRNDVAYLDSVTISEWARSVGIPDEVVHATMDPLMDMGNFLPADRSSALYLFRMIASMLGHWRDCYGVQFFQDSTDESIIQPLAKYLQERGGKIVLNAEVEMFEESGGRIVAVRTKEILGGQYICPICGEIHDSMPGRCRRCSYGGSGFRRDAGAAEAYLADFFLLGVDIPNARKILSGPPFQNQQPYPDLDKLTTSSIVTIYIWYPRSKGAGVKANWSDHFGDRECLMTADFPYLGTTLNLTYLKHGSFGEFDADVIETQVARVGRIAGMSDLEIVQKIDGDLRALLPGLPDFNDYRIMRWDNFTASTPGVEMHRPPMRTAFPNFLLLGDWIALEHNCFLMEKVTVNAKRAVNYLLEEIGQKEGHMEIALTGTPNLLVDFLKLTASVKE